MRIDGTSIGDSLANSDLADIAADLGRDFARYGLRLPQVGPGLSAMETVYREIQRLRRKPETSDSYIRKWLSLRYNALKRGRVVHEEVTADYIKRIDFPWCPVTHIRLTKGTGGPSDWSVDRIDNGGAYAPGNLCIISTRANRVKGNLSFEEILANAEKAEPTDTLKPIEWLRMASMAYGNHAAVHGDTLLIPTLTSSGVYFQAPSQLVQGLLMAVMLENPAGEDPNAWAFIQRCRDPRFNPAETVALLEPLLDALQVGGCACGWNDAWSYSPAREAFRPWWDDMTRNRRFPVSAFFDIGPGVADSKKRKPEIVSGWSLESRGYLEE